VIRLPLVRGLLNPAISVEWFFNGLVTAFVAAFVAVIAASLINRIWKYL
jgi:predicted lysophospholipase L1 biosynthesis ABC-type transport system permease subunit